MQIQIAYLQLSLWNSLNLPDFIKVKRKLGTHSILEIFVILEIPLDVWEYNAILNDPANDYVDHEDFYEKYPRERFEAAEAKLDRLVLRIGGIKETYPYDGNDTSDEDEYTEYSDEDDDSEVDGGYFYSLAEPCDHNFIKPWCDYCQEIADRYGLEDWM